MAVKLNALHPKLVAATLVESLTALAIVTTVIGCAFTLYEKTVSKQQQVMKTRAKFIQAQFERSLYGNFTETDLSNDFVDLDAERVLFNQNPAIEKITLLITDKTGKNILTKHYLKYIPGQ